MRDAVEVLFIAIYFTNKCYCHLVKCTSSLSHDNRVNGQIWAFDAIIHVANIGSQ